jgi:hypothetical protein
MTSSAGDWQKPFSPSNRSTPHERGHSLHGDMRLHNASARFFNSPAAVQS